MTFVVDSSSIQDAMWAIARGSSSAAFGLGPNGMLIGIVTDGDIRRALLQGATLNDPIAPFVERNPAIAREMDSRSTILDIMRSRSIAQVPVVDSDGRLVAVHLLRELLGSVERPNASLILAGGQGKRLAPLTETTPKPMVPVAGRPILERLIHHLVGYGIRRIFLATGYLGEIVEGYFGDGSDFGCHIDYLREDPLYPRGTGGPIHELLSISPAIDHPFIVMNGDLVTHFDVGEMLASHIQNKSKITVGTFPYTHEVPYGVLSLEHSGKVVSIVEKPLLQEHVNGGIYVVDPSIIPRVPDRGYVPMTQVISECIQNGDRVTAWPINSDWIDVGSPNELARARGH